MYPEMMVTPMRADLTDVGFSELRTPEEVVNQLENSKGTSLLVINSICGCAAGMARPAVKMALTNASKQPDHLLTVFAGVDMEATSKVREYTLPYPPSSPSIALFKDGDLIHFIERHHIEGRPASVIAEHLIDVFDEYC
jgi:putative YphP/YqiW family bacilliredoxin